MGSRVELSVLWAEYPIGGVRHVVADRVEGDDERAVRVLCGGWRLDAGIIADAADRDRLSVCGPCASRLVRLIELGEIDVSDGNGHGPTNGDHD